MVKKAWRRVLVFLVALAASLWPILSPPTPAAAAGTPALFAITGINQNFLSRLDPATGLVTPITADLGGANQGQVGSITGDPATHRIFGLRTSVTGMPPIINITNEVLTIDDQSGQFSVSQNPVNAPGGELAFDPSTNTLFLLAFNGLFRVDPVTGAATLAASLGNVCCGVLSMAVVPGAHTIYINNDKAFSFPPSDQMLTVDTSAGSVTGNVSIPASVRIITYDTSNGGLFGTTDCCPRQVVQIDPTNATATPKVPPFSTDPGQSMPFAIAVDPSTHTVFGGLVTFLTVPPFSQENIVSINDESGQFSVSSSPATDTVWSMYFEAPVPITPESIKADVRSALASGAIGNAGVAQSLLAKLDAASAARSRGECATAALIYQAFINELQAQSGTFIAASTATKLIGEAQFLIAHCP